MAIAADGTLAAIHEPTRVNIVEIPSCAQFAELGTDANAAVSEVAWVGAPPRLLVLSRYETHSIVHLVDPFGPRSLAEIRLETPMRLYAAVGSYALAIGAQGAAMLATTDKSITPYQFPARAIPVAAGASGEQFVVALAGAIEEWDPQSRMPKRRLKLPRPATITAVGGSERVVWMTTQQEPARIDVIPFVNRGQPKAHDLPEPIESVASHPRSDVIACVGATTGRVYVVDLDGRHGLRVVAPQGVERAEAIGIVLGRVAGVLAAQAQHAVAIAPFDRGESQPGEAASAPAAARKSSLFGATDEEHVQTSVTPALFATKTHGTDDTILPPFATRPATADPVISVVPPLAATPTRRRSGEFAAMPPPSTRPSSEFAAVPAPPESPSPPPPTSPTDSRAIDDTLPPPALGRLPATVGSAPLGAPYRDQLAGFRDRIEHPRAPTAEPVRDVWGDAPAGWRDALVEWTSRLDAGQPPGAPPASPIDLLVAGFDIAHEAGRVVALLYGSHLLGRDGAAPADVARVAGGVWNEALGRGDLARADIAKYAGSRVRLADVVRRALDELPPRTGTLVGAPGVVSLLGPCVIVAAGPLSIIAEACLPSIGGAILAAHGDIDPSELAFEARAYGAAPLWRVRADQLVRVPAEQPILLVAEDDVTADLLGVPRLT